MTIRFTKEVNIALRTAAMYRGDLSQYLTEAVRQFSPNEVDARPLHKLEKGTTLVVLHETFERLMEAHRKRGASINLLVNSVLHKFFFDNPKRPPTLRRVA